MSAPALPTLLVSGWAVPAAPAAAAVLTAGAYLVAARRARGWPVRRQAAFLAGLGTVVVALGSGLARYDDRLLSAHMVQHLLLLLVAPLLLLAGHPLELALRAAPRAARPRLGRALGRLARGCGPVSCLVVFYAVVPATHLPGFYDSALRHPAVHDLEHLLYLAAGGLMWWPLLDVDPVRSRRLSGLGRLVYLLAAMPSMAVVGAYLNRHASLVYPAYGPPARTLGVSALTDQQNAGAIMWAIGNTIMVLVGLWAAVGSMVADERRRQARERRAGMAGGAAL